jgi:SAM-dependent methyltransferase
MTNANGHSKATTQVTNPEDPLGDTHEKVSEYYGQTLQTSDDLKTNACTTSEMPPPYIRQAIGNCHDEVVMKYYGCGITIPECLEGLRVLDLGCGAGRDVYVLSALVGESGSVVGVDMTQEQLDVARKHVQWHTDKYGYKQPNVEFKHGYIEKLYDCQLEDNSFDLIVSNCVINLCQDKEAVLREAYRVLKPGGELYFCDVYSSRRPSPEIMKDPVLHGECLSGAMYWNDFIRLSQKCGFIDPRLVKDARIEMKSEKLEAKLSHIQFYSATYRLWKLPNLEPDCEDYGQAVMYKGTVPHCPEIFVLDGHHKIERGRVFPVCGNTYSMLKDTRFAAHFDFIGDQSTHYGIFENCGRPIPFESAAAGGGNVASCC